MKRLLQKTAPQQLEVEVIRAPTVAIIDDDVQLERAIARILRANYNCVVNGYRSVEEFLRAVDRDAGNDMHGVDLILLDFHLPGRDGPKLVEELRKRQSSILENSYIMGITGDSERVVYNEFKNAGIEEILQKPLQKLDYRRIADNAYKMNSQQSSQRPRMIKKYI